MLTDPARDPVQAVAGYAPHPLHTRERQWPQTNCYVDLWLEALHAAGLDPLACLGFTVAQDYEGDQFTFAKYPAEDMEILYGLAVQELSIYDDLQGHVVAQVRRGRLVLVEVDGWFLPDTRGLTYRAEHGKTTIGVHAIDVAARRLAYFHNSGLHLLDDRDYDGIFAPRPDRPDILPPYTEFVAFRDAPLRDAVLRDAATQRLRVHLRRRPRANPIAAWRRDFLGQLQALFDRPPAFFHQYAFNLIRQLGMNWELLGDFLRWLPGDGDAAAACDRIAETTKSLQFRVARLVARKRVDSCDDAFDILEQSYEAAIQPLLTQFG